MGMRHAKQRRFHEGDRGEVSGIQYQILRGGKEPSDTSGRRMRSDGEDLVLELYAGGRWNRITMDLGFFLAAFFFENEEVIRPPNPPWQIGGDYYMRECWDAIYHGWESSAQKLKEQRARRVNRLLWGGLSPDESDHSPRYPRTRT